VNVSGAKLFCILVLFSASLTTAASATPIQPDIKKLLSTPRPVQHFAPARAGWNGPETASAAQTAASEAMERYGPQATQRNMRRTLAQIATPDWRVFLGLATLILLLRFLRSRNLPEQTLVPVPISARTEAPESQRPAA
jgi:hypothetical protein